MGNLYCACCCEDGCCEEEDEEYQVGYSQDKMRGKSSYKYAAEDTSFRNEGNRGLGYHRRDDDYWRDVERREEEAEDNTYHDAGPGCGFDDGPGMGFGGGGGDDGPDYGGDYD